jgi:hypothetical protein
MLFNIHIIDTKSKDESTCMQIAAERKEYNYDNDAILFDIFNKNIDRNIKICLILMT